MNLSEYLDIHIMFITNVLICNTFFIVYDNDFEEFPTGN